VTATGGLPKDLPFAPAVFLFEPGILSWEHPIYQEGGNNFEAAERKSPRSPFLPSQEALGPLMQNSSLSAQQTNSVHGDNREGQGSSHYRHSVIGFLQGSGSSLSSGHTM
jgi:hypothetical protein